jgi:hypothetical protein
MDEMQGKHFLIKALSEIQKKLKAPKNQYNEFGKYSYRNCEDILEAVKPLIPEGYTLRLYDEIVPIGNRFYVKVTAEFTDGIQSITGVAFAREADSKKGMDDAQVTGAASSYARKYALNGLLLIDDTKDADSQEPVKKEPIETTSKPTVEPKEKNSDDNETRICEGPHKSMKGKKVVKKFCLKCFYRKHCPVVNPLPEEAKAPL